MQEEDRISRKQFLTIVASAAGAFIASRALGLIGSTTSAQNIDLLKNSDANAYGNFPYGGYKV